MSRASTSVSAPNVIFPPPQIQPVGQREDPYAKLSLPEASQSQILRSYQRDTSQIARLVDVVSELIRSVAGTRWLAMRQPIVDLMVKAVYLSLTLGRAVQTLGEEYTDILPRTSRSTRLSRIRRFATILLLLAPTVLTTSAVTDRMRDGEIRTTTFSRYRNRLADWLESPVGQSLAELNTIVFLYGGRYLEIGRRIMGLSYISTTAPRQTKRPSYEPLALLLALPLLARLWNSRQTRDLADLTSEDLDSNTQATPTAAEGTRTIDDEPNTYLAIDVFESDERQCTLCLEPRGTGEGSGGTVAVTECGHVFCWGCLGRLDKPECPLCRQSLRMERLIAAYNL